jgi:hypothetical protein
MRKTFFLKKKQNRNEYRGTLVGCQTMLSKCPSPIFSNQYLKSKNFLNGPARLKNCLNTNAHSHLETSGGQSSNLYLNAVHFFQCQY